MKTRKLIAMLLSLAMVIGLMTPAAMAEEGNAATGKRNDEMISSESDLCYDEMQTYYENDLTIENK